jgi:low affinity Fe/Cu permease
MRLSGRGLTHFPVELPGQSYPARRLSMAREPAAHSKNSKQPDSKISTSLMTSHGAHHSEWFSRFAHEAARLTGKPAAFIIAVSAVVIWAVTGPLFGYSDTWQLVINTSTTIVTFLMVFLIQNTQNRDQLALQVKLSELIIAVKGAENRFAAAEDLTEDELERLHDELRAHADATRESLEKRRAAAKGEEE